MITLGKIIRFSKQIKSIINENKRIKSISNGEKEYIVNEPDYIESIDLCDWIWNPDNNFLSFIVVEKWIKYRIKRYVQINYERKPIYVRKIEYKPIFKFSDYANETFFEIDLFRNNIIPTWIKNCYLWILWLWTWMIIHTRWNRWIKFTKWWMNQRKRQKIYNHTI